MIHLRKLALAITLALSVSVACATPLVYIIGDGGQFGTINLSTGSFTQVGPGISVGTGGLIQGLGGHLLSLGFDGNLNSISPATGVLSTIGATGLGDCSLPASPCGPHSANNIVRVGSSFYAVDLSNNLYTLNPATGATTLIGSTGIPALAYAPHTPIPGDPDGSFYIYDETLFESGGNLYATFDTGIFDPVTFSPTVLVGPHIYQVNTSTGIATSLTSTDFGLGAATEVNGTVYAFELPTSQVVTLNLATGSTSYVSDIDPSAGFIGGATTSPVPEPATLALVGSGLAFIGGVVRRGRKA